ncbi:uncharacterized protein LOC105833430 isoform X1 [Monomorium pharaonis]|uniref:uncharacterized protein LOC105833430 isoform X1 n=1 Tax=Monomorium pharaonis TaxID=307658 RepID=UPI0017476E6B|nr:uncharacterized protein LOC105833430 isoform X1 [Monomorium pharaonis]XP_036145039.1 uncharacterized protein LOC105833430 isoform X1 [Monomorium pharaonis]
MSTEQNIDNMNTRSPTGTDVAERSTRSSPHASPRVIREEPEEEAQELQDSHEQSGNTPATPQINRRPIYLMENMLHELLIEICELRSQLGNRNEVHSPPKEMARNTRRLTNHALDPSHGRSLRDLRHQHGSHIQYSSLKEARNIIPEINKTSRDWTTQHYETIAKANAEGKVKRPNPRTNGHKKEVQTESQQNNHKPTPQCEKCGKTGHNEGECRNTRHAKQFKLPRPKGRSYVNTLNAYCEYCKKSGHARNKCWKLHGHPKKGGDPWSKERAKDNKKAEAKNSKNKNKEIKKSKCSKSASSNSDESLSDLSSTHTAAAYHVTHVK